MSNSIQWWLLVYQDYPEGKMMLSSSHRSHERAETAREKTLRDPFWRAYFWSIHQVTKRPSHSQIVWGDLREFIKEHSPGG